MSGIERIAAERRRQIEVEGWTPEHDDQHVNGELAHVAFLYARDATYIGHHIPDRLPTHWPVTWAQSWWKPGPADPDGRLGLAGAIRMGEKAGALLAAQIDVWERLMAQQEAKAE